MKATPAKQMQVKPFTVAMKKYSGWLCSFQMTNASQNYKTWVIRRRNNQPEMCLCSHLEHFHISKRRLKKGALKLPISSCVSNYSVYAQMG